MQTQLTASQSNATNTRLLSLAPKCLDSWQLFNTIVHFGITHLITTSGDSRT